MAKIFVRQGNAAVDVSPELERLVQQLLDANPLIKKVMEDEIEDIYAEAYRQWPVRVDPPRTAEQKKEATYFAIARSPGKTTRDAFAITEALDDRGRFTTDSEPRLSKRSKDSKNKLERGIIIDSESITAFVRNSAPYAWAIKTGRYTQNNLAFGTSASNELLWKPVRRAGNRLVNKIARDLIKKAKR
jgi:hypothetical protein